MEKLIITAAVTGGEDLALGSPHLPRTPSAIVEAAVEAHAAGAAIVHLHARDESGAPTQDLTIYRAITDGIAARCDAIHCLTTGGSLGMSFEDRMRTLELAPEMASFDAGTLNFADEVFLNPEPFLRDLAARMQASRSKPELEIFDLGMVDTCLRLARGGMLASPLHFQFVLGVRGGAAATPANLVHLVGLLPPDATWSVTGIGHAQVAMAMLAIAMGGHVRVGMEDTARYSRGVYAKSNAQLVARIARIAAEADRPVATAAEARVILGLSEGGAASREDLVQ